MTTHSTPTCYSGVRRKLVLALDVGTTSSGISYSVLDPGRVPEIRGVTRFPAHEQISGASRIPTVIYYNEAGNVCAVGAEAMREGVFEQAEDEGWVKAELFKLHIHSKSASSASVTQKIPPLPLGKTVVRVLADFLLYLQKCGAAYIQDTYPNGRELWKSVSSEIDYVIPHPNGWDGYQQSQIRDAVVLAGLVPGSYRGRMRVSFVTEGEASLYFSIGNGLPTGAMQAGDGVVIVNAGKETIDISTYSKTVPKTDTSTTIGPFEEIAAPQCHSQGSIFVGIHARLFLEELLKDSEYYDDLDHIVRCFDKTTKIRFRNDKQVQYIKFGSSRDNDPTVGIRFGQLKLAGTDVAMFFEPSVRCIVDSVQQIKDAHQTIKHVVLLGGFSSNDWLFSKVEEAFRPKGINVVRPEIHTRRAFSDGAVSFYLDRFAEESSSSEGPKAIQPESPSPLAQNAKAQGPPQRRDEQQKIAPVEESTDSKLKVPTEGLNIKEKESTNPATHTTTDQRSSVVVTSAMEASGPTPPIKAFQSPSGSSAAANSPIALASMAAPRSQVRTAGPFEFDKNHHWELVTFIVQNCIFRVPVHRFIEESETFTKLHNLEGLVALPGYNQSDPMLNAIELEVGLQDFRAFLKLLYTRRWDETRQLTYEEWQSVLKLSTQWHFNSLRREAVSFLTDQKKLKSIQRIKLAEEYHVSSWLIRGYTELIKREQALTPKDAEQIDWRAALKLCELRQQRLQTKTFDIDKAVGSTFASALKKITEEEAKYGIPMTLAS